MVTEKNILSENATLVIRRFLQEKQGVSMAAFKTKDRYNDPAQETGIFQSAKLNLSNSSLIYSLYLWRSSLMILM